jgi:hypothetical protein
LSLGLWDRAFSFLFNHKPYPAAIKANASGIIVCYNHPSGNLDPGGKSNVFCRKPLVGNWQGAAGNAFCQLLFDNCQLIIFCQN